MTQFLLYGLIPVLVVVFLLVGAGYLAINGMKNLERGRSFFGSNREYAQKKMKIVPKAAICEPGICQCNCALSYHIGGGRCQVPGCPCQQFIPSNLSIDELAQVANGNLARLAVESVNARLDLETKTRALEAQTKARQIDSELSSRRSV